MTFLILARGNAKFLNSSFCVPFAFAFPLPLDIFVFVPPAPVSSPPSPVAKVTPPPPADEPSDPRSARSICLVQNLTKSASSARAFSSDNPGGPGTGAGGGS